MSEEYTDKQRREDLIIWFKENYFLEYQIRYYISIFDKITILEDIDVKRKKYLELQIEILKKFDHPLIK